MYNYSADYNKPSYGIRKHKSYGNVNQAKVADYEHDYGHGGHWRTYSGNQMHYKNKFFDDEMYNNHPKVQKNLANYIQVVSKPNHGGYYEKTQLYYNNYQIKVPEFVKGAIPIRKSYSNLRDISRWDRRYPYPPYFRDPYNKRVYSESANKMWGFSDTHLPYQHPKPRHFGSSEYLKRKSTYTEQLILYNRDVPYHRYPLLEPNDIPRGISTRKIRNNASMPNIGLHFQQNNSDYMYGHQNVLKYPHNRQNSVNFSIPRRIENISTFNIKRTNQTSNEDSVSLFCDDSFSSGYECRSIESPRVILSRSINNINKLAPHSVTDNLYISNDIKLIDIDDKLLYNNGRKLEESSCQKKMQK